jgi:hypothetical protein
VAAMTPAEAVTAWRAATTAMWKTWADQDTVAGAPAYKAACEALRIALRGVRESVDQKSWPALLERLTRKHDSRGRLRDAKTTLYAAHRYDKAAQDLTDTLIKEWDRGR